MREDLASGQDEREARDGEEPVGDHHPPVGQQGFCTGLHGGGGGSGGGAGRGGGEGWLLIGRMGIFLRSGSALAGWSSETQRRAELAG